jgi:hypothetical protein
MFKIEKRINSVGKWLPVMGPHLPTIEAANRAMREAADNVLDNPHGAFNVRFRIVRVLAAVACFCGIQ